MFAGLVLGALAPTSAQVTELSGISSKRYIVVDADTGEVFVEHNADEQVPIASLTKVFTTIEALEIGNLDQQITTSSSDLFGADSTTMGFGPGETFSLQDLLYGMMLPSGNDAAHAIARSLGYQDGASDDEAVDHFMGLINQRVLDMGLTNTHLRNPHGLSEENHYSTARDIATFVMYAMQYPTFQKLIGTSGYSTANGSYYVSNTNKLLNNYVGLIGGKTGYDDEAGYCLIEVATRNGSTMISVTLDGTAPDIWYQDNQILLDYAFQAKADRESAGRQITGNRLSFRDPDAATILAQSRSGNSIGAALVYAQDAQSATPVAGDLEATIEAELPMAGETSESGNDDRGRRVSPPIGGAIALISTAVAGFCIWKGLQVSKRREMVKMVTPDASLIDPPD
ncbi:MAG: D-alanyl-D-alanine carboxypeptidase [Thermomicrobiales bacterium]|nr:D-alanyl-D-alanine carboxypeptidase [Thermomicrobiales bacterium]